MHTIWPALVWWKSVSTHVAPESYARLIDSTVFCGTSSSHIPRCAMFCILSCPQHPAAAQSAGSATIEKPFIMISCFLSTLRTTDHYTLSAEPSPLMTNVRTGLAESPPYAVIVTDSPETFSMKRPCMLDRWKSFMCGRYSPKSAFASARS